MVLFLANFPDKHTLTEGMSQRMVAIDERAMDQQRFYLFVSHRCFWSMETAETKPGVIQYRCNLFRHFGFICKLLRDASVIYIHSVINLMPLLPAWLLAAKGSRTVFDAHGVVPEEHLLAGFKLKGRLYGLTESALFRRADVVVTVSRSMERHFRKKYPQSRAAYITYPILPVHLVRHQDRLPSVAADDTVRVVYSGNTQKWQNIELMLSLIRRNLSGNIHYDILTRDTEQMNRYLAQAGLEGEKGIHVACVPPETLGDYYSRAHYGFVLRDDITVNRVACPTKLVEYLYYGIIPIVKSPAIGDFQEMGYEYLQHPEFVPGLEARKSQTNRLIVERMLAAYNVPDIANLFKG